LLVWSHRAPSTGPRPGSRFAGKSGTRIFLFRAHPGSDRRVSWRRYEGLLALLSHEFGADAVHYFFETRRLIEDCRLAPVIYCDIDSAAGKTDSTLKVGHAAIQVATAVAAQQPFHGLRVFSPAFFLRVDGDMQVPNADD